MKHEISIQAIMKLHAHQRRQPQNHFTQANNTNTNSSGIDGFPSLVNQDQQFLIRVARIENGLFKKYVLFKIKIAIPMAFQLSN